MGGSLFAKHYILKLEITLGCGSWNPLILNTRIIETFVSYQLRSCKPLLPLLQQGLSYVLPATSPISTKSHHPSNHAHLHLFYFIFPLTVEELMHAMTSFMMFEQANKSSSLSRSWWNISLCVSLF